MTKVVVFILFLTGAVSENRINLCSFRKSEQSCMCKYQTKPIYIFPVLTADCTRLNLNDFPRDEHIPNVEELDASYNAITDLDSNKNNFGSIKLLSVKVAFNRIASLSQDFFQNVPNLRELDLSHNEIVVFANANVFRGLGNLTILNLRFNKLSTVPEDLFKPLLNLKELDLSYNYLGATLMNSDDFFATTLGVTADIEILKIDGLGIKELNYTYFVRATSLKHLSVSDNLLEEIPKLPYSINYLDLSGTRIKTISAKYLDYHSLKVLKLNRLKNLERIEHYAFYNLIALEELQVSESKSVKEFSDLVFGVMAKNMSFALKKLSISRTGIKTLNSSFIHLFKSLEFIDLQSNPWICDCNILWLQKFNGSLFRDDNIRCLTPSYTRMKEIMKLSAKDMPDCFDGPHSYQKALISVLGILLGILCVLILYLVYLGPFYQTNRGIGPESPYRGNTIGIDPNQAEDLS